MRRGKGRRRQAWVALALLLAACACGLLEGPAGTSHDAEESEAQSTQVDSGDVRSEGSGRQDAFGRSGGDGAASDGDEASDGLGNDDGGLARCLEALTGAGTQGSTWTEAGSVEQVASRLLVAYRDGEPCVLAQAGYLDLVGMTWACVVQGGAWVDVCVVSERDGSCQVLVLRYDREGVAEALAEEGEDDA